MDGFIARKDGDVDWLEVKGDNKGEDYGYNAFVGEVDAIVMGRKTFEKVLSFKEWPYGKTPVVVLSTGPMAVPPPLRRHVATMADRPSEILQRLARLGLHRLYIDGGRTIQGFLRAGLVDEITITRVPVLLGDGIPLFGALPKDVRLKHLETRTFKSGMVQTTYEVVRAGRPPKRRAPLLEDARDRSWRAFLEGMRVGRTEGGGEPQDGQAPPPEGGGEGRPGGGEELAAPPHGAELPGAADPSGGEANPGEE